jgi:hypothetical protein
MRYELSDYEWTAIKLMLPNKDCGCRDWQFTGREFLNGPPQDLQSSARRDGKIGE